MFRDRGPRRDLSATPGNPTHAIQQRYQELMAINDEDEFYTTARELVGSMAGQGISPTNARKFFMNLDQSKKRSGLTGMKFFVTNFMLKGAGMGTESKAPMMQLALMAESYLKGTTLYRGNSCLASSLTESVSNTRVMQDYFAKQLATWQRSEVTADQVRARLTKTWNEFANRGMCTESIDGFLTVLEDIHGMWAAGEKPMIGNQPQYKSEKQNLASYAAYWLTTLEEEVQPETRVRSEGVRRRPAKNESRRAVDFGVAGIAAVISDDPNDTFTVNEERRRLVRVMTEGEVPGQVPGPEEDAPHGEHPVGGGDLGGGGDEAAAFDKAANAALKGLQEAIKQFPKAAQAKKGELGKLVAGLLK
jgi:hypothetical protein